ncbi:MAG: hypothetical protein KF906_00590 [Actinobacteria bacterium]|nr:hypothetical protein [Actinomycetota bacterium]
MTDTIASISGPVRPARRTDTKGLPMTRSRARTSLAALAAATVLVTAGCGVKEVDGGVQAASGDSGVDAPITTGPTQPGSFEGTGGVVFLQEAADATASLDAMSMSMDMEMSGMPMLGDVSITMDGSIDNAAKKAHIVMDMSDMFDALGSMGSGDQLPDDAGVMEMIVDGDTTYVRSSLFSMMPGIDTDKPWMKASTDEMSDSEMFGQGATDPNEFLDFLKNNGNDVTEVGTEEVRGVETTHLHTVLDPEKMLANAAPEDADDLEASIEDLGATGILEIPVDVWIDGDGLVRKMVMEMDLSEVESDGVSMDGASMAITVEMYDLGEPVDVEIPDPSEVQELDASLLGD